jgi:hypothetical protein
MSVEATVTFGAPQFGWQAAVSLKSIDVDLSSGAALLPRS